MTIYKTVLEIMKKSRGTLLIGLILTGIFTLFYAGQLTNQYDELSGAKIAIVDQDNSDVSKSLEKMLDKQQRVISLEDTSEKGQDDALYFGNVNYIVTIPKGFGSSLSTESPINVRSQTKPGTFSKTLVDSSINRFISTYISFEGHFPSSTQQEILKMVEKNVEKEGKVNFDKSYQEKVEQQLTARIYNILAYGMFMTIFSGYALVNLVFNRKEISERNECSPISKVILSRRISLANLVYSFICFFAFMVMLFIMTQASFNRVTLYFIINSLLFLSVMISFSILVTSVIKNSETMSGINNIFILGSCFISGAFVPSSLLPEVVNKIAAFVPTYWFVANNELIGNTLSFNRDFSNKFLTQSFILVGFTCVFLLIHFILIKESSRKHSRQKMIG